jgi:DNA repair protein SbcC/Rad50
VSKTRDQLLNDFNTQLEQGVGESLVDWLIERQDSDSTPALLDRARSWLLQFTNNRYELRVGQERIFEATDLKTETLHRLSQLSDATRVQLILAARLAYIEQAEAGGEPVPLFLDEVLSTSDPDRFSAVGAAIMTMAKHRQIFYATASSGEVAQWRDLAASLGMEPLRVIELGKTAQDWKVTIPKPEKRQIPAPQGESPIEYAEKLGLQRPSLFGEPKTWPLALVLYDDQESAYMAAKEGIGNIGQLEALIKAGINAALPKKTIILAVTRQNAITATLDALRVGRGRPLDWGTLDKSGIISDAFSEKFKPLVRDHGHDANTFMERADDIKGFRKKKLEQLHDHLLETGHLDTRATLSKAQLLERIQISCSAEINKGELQLGELPGILDWVSAIVDAQGEGPSVSS